MALYLDEFYIQFSGRRGKHDPDGRTGSAGKAGWKVTVGSGPEIISTPKYILRFFPVGGYFVPGEKSKTNKAKMIIQFLFTALPIRYRIICRGFESDGLQIVHVLKQKES